MWGPGAGGWLLARSALAGQATGDAELAETQLVLARFYAEQLLPQSAGLLGAATAGSRDLFALDADQL
ncbi:MAG: acyl-CoA dehydrogenase C-terminal domain-containing protein, partial [Lacisediminihabitans sp.]